MADSGQILESRSRAAAVEKVATETAVTSSTTDATNVQDERAPDSTEAPALAPKPKRKRASSVAADSKSAKAIADGLKEVMKKGKKTSTTEKVRSR